MASLYSVTYNTNNSTGGTTPPTQSATSDSTSYSFIAPTPDQYGLVKDGYTFMGWAESPSAVFEDYKANTTIELSNTNPTKTLYAVWGKNYTYQYSTGEGSGTVPASTTIMLGNLPYTMTPNGTYDSVYRIGYLATGWNNITFTAENPSPTTTPTWIASNASNFNVMQEIGTTGYCDAIGTTGRQLGDLRDGKKYWVAKLADGNCWMTQNLDLDLSTDRALTSADSDVANWTPPENTQTSTTPNFGQANNNIKSWDPALGGNPTYCNNGTTAGACKTSGNPTTSVNNGHDAQGNYYSWGAATAGQAASISSANQDATQSICPKGWRLPSNNSSVGPTFAGLGLTTANILKDPYYFVYGGYVTTGSLYNAGSYGYYWSSTSHSSTAAYYLSFTSGGVNPSSNNARYIGLPARCIAR